MLKLDKIQNGDQVTIFVKGVIDTETSSQLNEALLALDYADLDLTLDFKDTVYITSAGLRVLLVARKKLSDGTMRILHVNENIAEVFETTGFSGLLNFSTDPAAEEACHMSFKSLLRKKADDGSAFWYKGREYTWADVDRVSQIIADDLAKAGVRKGSHVGICAMNSINWIFTFFAVQKLGAIAVLVNFGLKPNEIAQLAEIGDITHLCYGAVPGVTDYQLFSKALLGGQSKILHMYDIGTEVDFTARLGEYEAVKDKYSELYHADDASVIIFTSGSTGRPKAVLSSSYNLLNCASSLEQEYHLNASDRNCAFLPMFHVFGFVTCISVGLLYGCYNCIPSVISPEELINVISEQKCTIFNTVPTMLLSMIRHPGFSPEKLATVRVSGIGGAATSEAQMRMLQKLLPNDHFCNVYGMSENAAISLSLYEDTVEHITQTVGKPTAGVEIEIRDPQTGKRVPDGQPGEVCIRSKTMIVCYYRLAIEAQPLDDEGWLATGDLGIILPDGYLKLVGRAKELIIRGGENISPGEVADAVAQLPGVADVKVLGVPDEVYGEKVAAVLVMKDGAAFDRAQAEKLLSEKIAKYKIPSYFLTVDRFPLLGSGKVDGVALKQTVLAQLGIHP